jgi:hypothetical protein
LVGWIRIPILNADLDLNPKGLTRISRRSIKKNAAKRQIIGHTKYLKKCNARYENV